MPYTHIHWKRDAPFVTPDAVFIESTIARELGMYVDMTHGAWIPQLFIDQYKLATMTSYASPSMDNTMTSHALGVTAANLHFWHQRRRSANEK